MLRICTLCVRGGSKGLKNKNILLLAGKPLLAHSIAHAKQSGLFDKVVVSSDSSEILETAERWGADLKIVRPPEMATDQAAKLPAIRHAVLTAESLSGKRFDTVVELDATSPLRTVEDVKNCVALHEARDVTNVITAAPARHSPYFNMIELDEKGFARLSKKLEKPVVRRQDAPRCFDMNASIYVWKRDAFIDNPAVFFEDTLLYEMPRSRSVDIDDEIDFELVKLLMARERRDDGL